jgi:hypothetical protein
MQTPHEILSKHLDFANTNLKYDFGNKLAFGRQIFRQCYFLEKDVVKIEIEFLSLQTMKKSYLKKIYNSINF